MDDNDDPVLWWLNVLAEALTLLALFLILFIVIIWWSL